MDINFIFSIAILILSVVLHEISHGYAAYFLGDPTAKYAGRLTLNPLKHIDMFGSVIFPAISFLLGGFIFGWAKPVPYNPYNVRHGKWGEAIVAFAGPVSNIVIAGVFSVYLRYIGGIEAFSTPAGYLASYIVLINLSLAIFNLLPIPPLDGSKILSALLPLQSREILAQFERHSFIFVLIFVIFLWQFLAPIVPWVFKIFTGFSIIGL